MYSEPIEAFKMEIFAKIVGEFKSLTVFVKISILDVWLGLLASITKIKVVIDDFTQFVRLLNLFSL